MYNFSVKHSLTARDTKVKLEIISFQSEKKKWEKIYWRIKSESIWISIEKCYCSCVCTVSFLGDTFTIHWVSCCCLECDYWLSIRHPRILLPIKQTTCIFVCEREKFSTPNTHTPKKPEETEKNIDKSCHLWESLSEKR